MAKRLWTQVPERTTVSPVRPLTVRCADSVGGHLSPAVHTGYRSLATYSPPLMCRRWRLE